MRMLMKSVYRQLIVKVVDKVDFLLIQDFPYANENSPEDDINGMYNSIKQHVRIPMFFVQIFWENFRTHHNHTTSDWVVKHTEEQIERVWNKLQVPDNQWENVFENIKYELKKLLEKVYHRDMYPLYLVNIGIWEKTSVILNSNVVSLCDYNVIKKIFSKKQMETAYDRIN